MSVEQSLPQLLEDLRALRAEIDATGTHRGGNPLTSTCNDLAYEIAMIGGLEMRAPLQCSGRRPAVEQLLTDMRLWRAANAPREPRAPGDPIVINHPSRRY